jgi:hypothetical protein
MMERSLIVKDCEPCEKIFGGNPHKRSFSVISGILLAFLPKCPFCFMAFTNTLILCGEGNSLTCQRTFSSSTTSLLSILFCSIILLSIILNYRDSRTKYAIALALIGSLFVILSVIKTGGLPLYYFGIIFIFGGVWLNASLLYFLRKIKENLPIREKQQLINNG